MTTRFRLPRLPLAVALLSVLSVLMMFAVFGTRTASAATPAHFVNSHSNMCMEIFNLSHAESASANQWACWDGPNQTGVMTAFSDGSFEIRFAHSGKCLEVLGWSTRNGDALGQYSCHGGDNQRWYGHQLSNGAYLIQSKFSQKCMEVYGWDTSNGAELVQWDCHNGNNQQWRLFAASGGGGNSGGGSGTTSVVVTRVIDGDTIELSDGSRVRYIGIDTPESTTQHECFGQAASARNKQLVEGKTVQLEKDVSETDRYGRLLRYVYVDGVMVNEQLVLEGYAQVSTFPPDVKYQNRFLAAQQQAREAGRGLWSQCGDEGPPSSNNQCDPSYPTVCIAPYPPDLDCGQIPFRHFQVVGADPHGFDGNGDGEGCES